jgi:outer membrane murein-binding lipoprotein Lpp
MIQVIASEITHGGILDIVLSLWVPVSITAVATVYVAKVARENRKRIDTGNDKDLGTTVHDMAQTVEILSAQIHTNTSETLAAREKAEQAVTRLDDWIAESTHVHAELLRRLPTTGDNPDGDSSG